MQVSFQRTTRIRTTLYQLRNSLLHARSRLVEVRSNPVFDRRAFTQILVAVDVRAVADVFISAHAHLIEPRQPNSVLLMRGMQVQQTFS